MAADLRHTLINLEVTPPPGAWNAIASRLDIEFDSNEIKVAEKISDFELPPPVAAWENIAAAIVADPGEVEAAPTISINRSFRKWAVAAAAIVILAVGGWYFMDDKAVPKNDMTVVPEVKPETKTTLPEVKDNVPEVSAATARTSRPLPRRTLIASAKGVEDSRSEYEPITLEFAEPPTNDYQPRTRMRYIQPAKNAPAVEAPLIRDDNGNIILDKQLILASDNNYIVVTGPNGEQTRISAKFLPLLSSLNSNYDSQDYFQIFLNENNIWKLRFDEWRDKMLKQADFIPTATNLLDLLELKEFLQEN